MKNIKHLCLGTCFVGLIVNAQIGSTFPDERKVINANAGNWNGSVTQLLEQPVEKPFSFALPLVNQSGRHQNSSFETLYRLIKQRNFFKAREDYYLQKNNLTETCQLVLEALLDNAFNRVASSNLKIARLLTAKEQIPDSIMLQIFKTQKDNSVKMFDYRGAKDALTTILDKYNWHLSDGEKNDIENEYIIWSSLESQAKQQVRIGEGFCKKMTRDKAGLANLTVVSGNDSVDFIFDTGANLSTTTETTAGKLNMKIIPVDIEVGTITGRKVPAKLAVCPLLTLGNIEIVNSVFLVMKDETLLFSQIGYQINGILGFPIIEALKEIQITPDGYFIVPKEETRFEATPNLAMDGLTPMVLLNNKYFTLDTGADSTILYRPYFEEHRQEITANFAETTLSFGGAGGMQKFQGYKIDFRMDYNGKKITLKNVSLLTESADEVESGVYGNIGQDLISQFDKLTLNFKNMFLKFD